MVPSTASEVVKIDLDYVCTTLTREFEAAAGSRFLITGGGGFLGYYLVQAISHWNTANPELPIPVTVLDNFMRGVPVWLSDLAASTPDTLDLRQQDIVEPIPNDLEDVGYIIHAASIASPIYYRKYPLETMDANVLGLRNLLEWSVNRGAGQVKGFLNYSTSEIYGDPTPENIPTSETYRGNVSCTGPRACYDESKRYGETLSVNFANQHDVPIRIARPFNNYGPGLKITDGRALPDFARNVLTDQDLVLFSDGSPTRTFCYVADAIIGYFLILFRGRNGEPYNIGVEAPEISMRHFAERVIEIARRHFDYKGALRFANSEDAEYLTDNPNRRCPNIEKARVELGYDPKIGLDVGLERSLIWYAENQSAEDG